jgi:hypothetical protein
MDRSDKINITNNSENKKWMGKPTVNIHGKIYANFHNFWAALMN